LIGWRRWVVQQGVERVDCRVVEVKEDPLKEDGFRFAACGLDHEFGSCLAQYFRGTIDEISLLATCANIDGLVSRDT